MLLRHHFRLIKYQKNTNYHSRMQDRPSNVGNDEKEGTFATCKARRDVYLVVLLQNPTSRGYGSLEKLVRGRGWW